MPKEPDQFNDTPANWPDPLGPAGMPLISESFTHRVVPPENMDVLWAGAWRHFGPLFVRYSVSLACGWPQTVQPLRVVLDRFQPSRSQRRILRRNANIEVRCAWPVLDEARHRLFQIHKRRFTQNIPQSLEDFLGPEPGVVPCEMIEVAAYENGCLLAASYLDVGRQGVSSVYAMFDPQLARRSLGIATMLWEIDHARQRGARYYYPGYAYHEPSAMDYKKQFAGTEWFDWRGRWLPLLRRG